jgi:hypothetical protein
MASFGLPAKVISGYPLLSGTDVAWKALLRCRVVGMVGRCGA